MNSPNLVKPPIQIGPKRKIAFACSGGATKAGAFHLGVCLALQEHGFKFIGGLLPKGIPLQPPKPMEIATYIGTSAGSIISAYLAAGYSLNNIFNSFQKNKPDHIDPTDALPKILPRLTYQKMLKFRSAVAKETLMQLGYFRQFFSSLVDGRFEEVLRLNWLKTTGIFSTEGIEQFLREEVLPSNRFEDYLADLFVVGTQLNHSRKIVFGKYRYKPPTSDLSTQYNNQIDISHACAGSTAMPPVFAPYPIRFPDGKEINFIDGEIRDTLSTNVAVEAGVDLVFASHTHQPYHFQKTVGSLTQYGLPAIAIQSIYLMIEQKVRSAIHHAESRKNALHAVSQYCKNQNISNIHRMQILEILEKELHYRENLDIVYFHPDPKDAAMFFGEHFTLSSRKLSDFVRSGFRAGINTLSRYHFADKPAGH